MEDDGPKTQGAAGTLATLGLLGAVLPLNAALTAVALLRGLVAPAPVAVAAEPRTIMVSGGKMSKALQLARSFHRAGHRVVLVEAAAYRLTGHRFSRAVSAFHTIPPAGAPGYAAALVEIAQREGVDLYVPVCSPASAHDDAQARAALSEHCDVFHFDPATLRRLDDKHEFSLAAEALGLAVPAHHRITSPEQVVDLAVAGRTWILKSIPYDPVRRLDLTRLPRPTREETAAFARALPISEEQPWILQEFIAGREFCTHSTVVDGAVQLHCCCPSSAFQINYEMVDKPAIEAWVRRFVGEQRLTGQVSIDFIEAPDGTVRAIECNPRTHSAITMFYDHPGVAAAYLEASTGSTAEPTPGSRPTHWLYHELWRLATQPGRSARARSILRGKDAIFDWADPLPFLLVHHLQLPALLLRNLRRGTGWIRVDFNIGKLVEPGGD